MSALREAAQQALEALECGDTVFYPQTKIAITALKAALAEPDLSRCPKCGGHADNGHDREVPPNPYYCTKCMAEPVQEPCNKSCAPGYCYCEPVAWIHTDPDNPRVEFLEWRDGEPGYRGRWIKTPLYTTPPQRKPMQEPVAWQWLDTPTFKARLPERAVVGEWRPLYAKKGTP